MTVYTFITTYILFLHTRLLLIKMKHVHIHPYYGIMSYASRWIQCLLKNIKQPQKVNAKIGNNTIIKNLKFQSCLNMDNFRYLNMPYKACRGLFWTTLFYNQFLFW